MKSPPEESRKETADRPSKRTAKVRKTPKVKLDDVSNINNDDLWLPSGSVFHSLCKKTAIHQHVWTMHNLHIYTFAIAHL